MGSLCAGNQTTTGNTTNAGTSTGASNVNQAGTNTNTSTPTYGSFIGQGLSSIPGLYAPANSAITAGGGSAVSGIPQYLNPYNQAVTDANNTLWNTTINPQARSNILGTAAKQGALTGSGATGALAQYNQQAGAQQGAQNASMLQSGFNTALGASQADLARLLQSGQGLGSLAGSQLSNIGSLVGQGGQTSAGANTGTTAGTTAGTTNNVGTSNSSTTYNPSLLSSLGGLAGLGISGYNSGAFSGLGSLFGLKDGGAVKGFDEGGWVPTITPYNGGPASDDDYWNRVQGQALANPNGQTPGQSPSTPSFKDALEAFNKSLQPPQGMAAPAAPVHATDNTNPSLAALGQIMSGLHPQGRAEGGPVGLPSFHDKVKQAFHSFHSLRKTAEGGGAKMADGGDPGVATVTPEPEAPMRAGLSDVLPQLFPGMRRETPVAPRVAPSSSISGVIEQMPRSQIFANALMSIPTNVPGLPGYKGVADSVMSGYNQRNEAARAQNEINQQATALHAKLWGEVGGHKTLEGEKAPLEREALKAHSEEGQIRIKAIEQANTLHQQRLKSIDDMEFVDPNPAGNSAYYQQQRAAAEVAHEAALRRLQGQGASQPTPAAPGLKSWNPNLPNGGL